MSKTTNDKTWQVIALGGPTELSDWELVAALSSGELDPDSKVWRAGWAEWLPASVVGELRTALPEKSRRPERFPAPQASEAPPPALPQSTARAALETPVPSGPQGVVVRSAASSEARRVPMPTLMETERVTPTATLRPPGAIPPPPRAMPPTPSVAPRGTPLGALAPAAAPRRASDDAPSTPVSTPEPRAASVPPDRRSSRVSLPRARRLRAIIVLLAGLSALLAGALAAVLLGRKPPRERAEPPATAPSVPRAASPKACRVTARPRLLARNISLAVPLKLEAVADGKRVALGMAETATVAAGYTLDPDTLEAARAFTSDEGPEISGVTPLTSKQPLSFAVDRADSPLRWPTSIDTVPRTTVGVADAGFSRWTRGQTPRVLWRGDGAEPITTPRVARAPDGRFAVTFRRGGQDGSVLVGWLDRDGTARGELGRIGAGGRLVGTPAIAATASEILVAFASRGTETEPWHVELARAPHDRLPSAARRTPLPNAEHDAMSPALAALPDGHWLLQWTERLQAKYRVRVALLDSALEPLGRPLDVSPEGVDAGQGALWAGGARALSLYAVNEDQRQELWGVQLRCP